MQLKLKKLKKINHVIMPRDMGGELSYRMKCYCIENEKIFGDLIITHQNMGHFCINELSQVLPECPKKIPNLAQETLETPDFMLLNRNISLKEKHKQKLASFYSSVQNKSNICTVNYNGNACSTLERRKSYPLPSVKESNEEILVSSLVDQLLLDIYRYPRHDCHGRSDSDSTVSSSRPSPHHHYLQKARLELKSQEELNVVLETLRVHINHAGGLLIRQLRRRDYLRTKRDRQYDVITAHLQAYSNKRSEDMRMRFSLMPQPGESGFRQWLDAMRMVARLPEGIPEEFRKRLWLTLAERHLEQRGVDWKQAEKLCFNEWTNPDDEELGIQIVKDLHRTGCSLFCGAAGRDNQAVLRRVLLGYARWNKAVGYCQGLNVLAALVLQVIDRNEAAAVKVMIYLIEGVLPEGYYADNLRGLSIDMAVFRDLLKQRLPKLSKHLESLQSDIKDKATGSSYEPPLTNVFTMQWFLTLFCHCLPQDAVLRVWDLIFLEGDEVLLKVSLAIWEGIADRIMTVTSADEFYSIMGVLMKEMLEFTDTNNLIQTIVNMGNLQGITNLREKHRYNITPWTRKLSDDEDTDTEDDEKMAVATAVLGVPQRFKKDRRSASNTLQMLNPNEGEKIALDIGSLKKQYAKIRERQRQAHIILSAACARQTMVSTSSSQAMNHLLVGKSALVSSKTRQLRPPPGSIPQKIRINSLHGSKNQARREKQGITIHWKDMKDLKKLKDPKNEPAVTDEGESESFQSSENLPTSTKSSRRESIDSDSDSTSTELCDEIEHLSDSEEPTSTSDYYVMASDDDKSPQPGSSPIPGKILIHSVQNSKDCPQHSTQTADEMSEENLDEISIAKITDQIRRLSADDNSLEISHVSLDEKSELENEDGKDLIDESFQQAAEKSIVKPMSDDFLHNFETKVDNEVKFNDDFENLKEKSLELLKDDITELTVNVEKTKKTAEPSLSTESSIISLKEKTDNEELKYSSHSSNFLSDFEISTSSKVPISSKSDIIDGAIKHPNTSETELDVGNEKRSYYPCSYVIGHLPISPVTVEQKLSKLIDSDYKSDRELKLNKFDHISDLDKADITPEVIRSDQTLKLDKSDSTLHLNKPERILELKKFDNKPEVIKFDRIPEFKKADTLPELLRPNRTLEFYKSDSVSELSRSDTTPEFKTTRLSEFDMASDRIIHLNKEKEDFSRREKIVSEDLKDRNHTFTLDSYSQDLNVFQDKKRSPKTPESNVSFSSGETMGPDSKVSSMATSPRTPMRPDSCKFDADKSEHSSTCSTSKTLTLASNDSEIRQLRLQGDSQSEITRPSFDKSTPSTSISTDSLKNKSDPSPSKLIVSSSSDSYNSPNKTKYSERSFSSGLQSPISANSIKYTSNYGGIDDIPESPGNTSVISPFYPISNPNSKKSSSPNRGSNSSYKISVDNENKFDVKYSNITSENSIKPSLYLKDINSSSFSQTSDIKISKSDDDYDSGRPFEAELAATLSKKTQQGKKETDYEKEKKSRKYFSENIQEEFVVGDDKNKSFSMDGKREGFDIHLKHLKLSDFHNDGKTNNFLLHTESKPVERSCSSLDKRFGEMKLSASAEDFFSNKKRSSDILADLRHLEASSSETLSTTDANITRATGYDWEDLKNLEARRQDTFSDSASQFSKYRIDIPSISITDGRKGYVVEPKIQIDENSDSILKNYTQKKANGEPDDDKEAKLGVWTKVKPRKRGENGRRSSNDRALKIIQENSAILHKILTCQAKKCLPDLEEISKEITISPINEEISKIFSPILEKMGFNEHEINEELARINFKDFDQMTTTGSEFDAKINDELLKLSIIDDNDLPINPVDTDEIIVDDYLDTREALIDKQINDELSRLLVNFDRRSPACPSYCEKSLSQNQSDLEAPDISSISTNVFSYNSSNDSIDTRSDLGSIQDSVIQSEKFPQYSESTHDFRVNSTKYELQNLSPKSDIDIYRELEKLDKISSARVFPVTTPSTITQKLISPNAYTTESLSFSEVLSSLEYPTKPEKPFETSPLECPHSSTSSSSYKPYDFQALRILSHKSSNNPFAVHSYKKSLGSDFEFDDDVANSSRTYDIDLKRQILSKEILEFRVRYDDEPLPSQRIHENNFPLESYQPGLLELDRGVSYYSEKSPVLKSLTSPSEFSYDKSNTFSQKNVLATDFVYPKTPENNYERQSYQISESESEVGSYVPLRRRNSQAHSPNYQFTSRDFGSINTYTTKLSPSLQAAGPAESVSHPEFTEKHGSLKYTEVPVRDSITYRKTSMTLEPLENSNRVGRAKFNDTPSPKTQFNPFPIRNTTRRPKELGLKLGLYSPTSFDSDQSKRS
ncbi:uncharacterized protein [Chelonus insularis]|uniref:uncharacterized protein isoform X2 n=1 Tax=Chelonus insularis TaxID=460826 RepID=UPI001589ACE4|nr:uncharacterized protein LOC118064863 isoform X2 [Chelonus insularis]